MYPPATNLLSPKKTLTVGGRLLDLTMPRVMGILNATPDSFFAPSRAEFHDALLFRAEEMLRDGADILDIGGQSTRPKAEDVGEEEELRRVLPAIEAIAHRFPEAIISVDTYRARVGEEAVRRGASVINDVSGGLFDEAMFETVAKLQVPYVLMHTQGRPDTMQENPQYEDVVKEVLQHLSFRLDTLTALGVNDVILDPGFGFGKTTLHNYQLLKRLPLFGMLGRPVLAGVSRKSMINRVIGSKPETALNGTTAVHVLALLNGASLLRVHDVREARECVKIVNYYLEAV